MFFTPGTHKDAGLAYNPLKAIVAPRPIGWIASRGSDKSLNLAPYSFFNAIAELPPMVMFSAGSNPDGSDKDSLRNVRETGEFTVNIVGAAHGDAMNITSGSYAYGSNEFKLANLGMVDGETINVPRVANAPAALECTHWQTIVLPADEGAHPCSMVIGRVTGIYIDDNVIVDGKIDNTLFQPLARLGYKDYAKVTELFEMTRPITTT